ncbi:hypothetical protein KPL71_013668 [Citrus sinensis]|uniref:Uncharacterized protein n=1 Tax=Citrus sinensis TaxID=2711 RepID=A0ACB8LM53_CITSI|nr:hypothetical protein KPL71_013668 [Citrus sinensis]
MAVTEEPILSRLDRLDNLLRQLEEIRRCNGSPKSSCASTPSSGTFTSEGQASSVEFSPNSLEKHCRPIDRVVMETGVKGTVMERLDRIEAHVLKAGRSSASFSYYMGLDLGSPKMMVKPMRSKLV